MKVFIFFVGLALGAGITECCSTKVSNYNQLAEANDYKRELCIAYGEYQDAAEALLDQLNEEYNWVDGYDPYDYYEAKGKVDSLLMEEL